MVYNNSFVLPSTMCIIYVKTTGAQQEAHYTASCGDMASPFTYTPLCELFKIHKH